MSTSKIKKGLFIKLPSYVKEMKTKELQNYFPPGTIDVMIENGVNKGKYHPVPFYTKSYLMRSIIMNEKQFSDITYNRTLRGMWYQVVKPTLDKLGLLTEEDKTEEGLTQWDKTLSRYVCDLLRRGELMFSDLSISDTSRQKENPSESYYTVSNETFGYKGSLSPYPNLLIATEKDTVYQIIKNLASLFGCSCISSKGQNSLGAMEVIIEGMFDSEEEFDTIYILTLTDYDPAGYYIADALKKQAEDILKALNRYDEVYVEIKRIGIEPDQLSDELVESNKYTPKKANLAKWMQKTNGINGEEKGLELDALTPKEIRKIFVDKIAEFIEEDKYIDFIKGSYLKLKMLESIEDRIEEIYQDVYDEFNDQIELNEFDIKRFALRGMTSFPIEDLCNAEHDDDIQELSLSHFR